MVSKTYIVINIILLLVIMLTLFLLTYLANRGKMIFDVDTPHHRYHMGIVDFLQKYTARKHLETIGKGLWYNANRISAVDSKFYAQRFLRFIKLMCGLRVEDDTNSTANA